ncbi:Rv1733c family protein [Streptomyces cyaneochromogenes]|uniref:Rv1733c family protein n=1 Tax=Streptomyces cyaneochromogenes TaxID=2496836 RepID=UPI00158C0631|nr:hypothetical protein [Streptomyces cyaneochromogenes]
MSMTRAGRLCWRLRRNPLRRRSYLVEAWLLLLTWALAIVAAVVTGVATAYAVERNMDSWRAERRAVTAVLTEDADLRTSANEGSDDARAWATVRWTGPDGTSRTGVTRVEPGSQSGDATRVWLNAKGQLVPEPATVDQAELQGAVLGTVAAVSVGAMVTLIGWGACAWLDRRRLRQWDTEWAEVGPRWRRKAG